MLKILRRIIHRYKNIRMCARLQKCGNGIQIGKGFTVVGPNYIDIGDNFTAGNNLSLAAYEYYKGEKTGQIPTLSIGNNVSMMDNCAVSCIRSIRIGDGVLCGANVFITDNFHGNNQKEDLIIQPSKRKLYSKGSVIIGDNVWIGRNVCIMPGVVIGNNSVIGANAVVTSNIPAGAIAAGVPARVIREGFE